MAWTSPRTWAAAEVLTAALLNTHLRDNLSWLAAFGAGGTAFSAEASAFTDLARVATGSYTGDGTDSRGITGVGFEPKIVIIKASSNYFVTRFEISGDSSWRIDGTDATQANFIESLDSDGFTVGTSQNTNAVVYYYIAIG